MSADVQCEAERLTARPHSMFADFILHRMDSRRLTYREIASMSGLGRSRVHYTLHRNRSKRRPLRVDEAHLLLSALGVTQLEALVADEVLAEEDVEFNALDRLVGLISCIVSGLKTAIPELVGHLDGLEWDDVRPEHGKFIQKCVVRELTERYAVMLRMRDLRMLSED